MPDKTNISPSPYLHIIVAGGTGKRFGSELPKQFNLLCGKPVLIHTVERIRKFGRGGKIVIVMAEEWWDYWKDICAKAGVNHEILVKGGETRWHSVKSALDTAVTEDITYISVHDAARPLIDKGMMDRLLNEIETGTPAVVPVIDLNESLRKVDNQLTGCSTAVKRTDYKLVQTPQVFDKNTLISSYAKDYSPEFTDDASVVEKSGHKIKLIEGSRPNIKITYPVDLKIARLYIEEDKDGAS